MVYIANALSVIIIQNRASICVCYSQLLPNCSKMQPNRNTIMTDDGSLPAVKLTSFAKVAFSFRFKSLPSYRQAPYLQLIALKSCCYNSQFVMIVFLCANGFTEEAALVLYVYSKAPFLQPYLGVSEHLCTYTFLKLASIEIPRSNKSSGLLFQVVWD